MQPFPAFLFKEIETSLGYNNVNIFQIFKILQFYNNVINRCLPEDTLLQSQIKIRYVKHLITVKNELNVQINLRYE